jgi:ferredoxin-NADP reductase
MLPDHDYHELAVADVVDETDDTRSFRFDVPLALRATFAYEAGQFCTFRAVIDGAEVVRCYSMSSSPDATEPLTTTVKRVPGGRMSNWMNDTLTPGSTIEVMRPTGLFVLHDHTTPIVAFAGGSGITPVMSIVKRALATTDRRILLVDANRSGDAIIFAAELERLRAASGGRLSVHHHLDHGSGFLDRDACAALAADHVDADFYVCGPTPFMDVVDQGLSALGVPADRRHVERFVLPDEADAPPDAVGPDSAAPRTVVFRIGRRKHTVDHRAGDTLLETARRGGLDPPFSCEAGNCATCMAHLDAGTVRMRANNALTPEELDEGWVLTCQSVPTSAEIAVDYDA